MNKLYKKAKKDFDSIIKNSTEEQKEKFANGSYGLDAYHWAVRYITPKEDQKTYNRIYNILYNWCENYKKGASK